MTKGYLESLPEEQQNEILGRPGADEEAEYYAAYDADAHTIEAGGGSDDDPDYGDLPW